MAILKCKMCGGDVELVGDKTYGICDYCGCTMTFPKVDDDQRAAAFNRGNHFRRIGEFDKALAVYERIVQEDNTDAEAHWCCALCRFGIEYVEDPTTMEWLPTCHRASFDSFLEDVDYLAAVEYSSGITQRQYQKDAAKIADVQRGILATSQNAQPYDVFICYKETDAQGNRTKDSLMAQDIYYQLTEQGRKVFFARITLEDVAGAQYEPYIFAALNSAKVMIVVGTTPENLSAVWVKNEWSRFLSLMKKDHSKLLLPCYRDMDPYDLPEQLSVLQSYDMAKIGFIQDLIRGVAKVLDAEKQTVQPTVVKETVVTGGGGNAAPLLKRAFMFLEDGDWQKADEFCEQVLNIDPECGEAYLGKLMAELHVNTREALKDCALPFDQYNNYQKAMRFGDEALKTELQGYLDCINELNRQAAYNGAVQAMNNAQSEEEYLTVAERLKKLGDYADTAQLVEQCREKAEIARKDAVYHTAIAHLGEKDSASVRQAIDLFTSISDWKDADKQIEICREKLQKIKEEQRRLAEEKMKAEARQAALQARRKKMLIIGISIFAVFVLLWTFALRPWISYKNGYYRIYVNRYNVSKFTIPDGVTEIQHEAFRNCDTLTSVVIPDSVTTIGERAFAGCGALQSITIPDSVTTIDDGAFSACVSLESITIPNGVTYIGEDAFSGCTSLTSVNIPDSVTDIGEGAFEYCLNLKEIVIDSQAVIDNRCLAECTDLQSIIIGDSVTTIGGSAFSDCDSLTSVTIGDSVTTIGDYAFYSCDSLTSVTIPDSVTTIGEQAFYSCFSLTSVTIPDSVTTIGDYAFYTCFSLTDVYFKGTKSQWKALNVRFTYSVTVHCSDGTYQEY